MQPLRVRDCPTTPGDLVAPIRDDGSEVTLKASTRASPEATGTIWRQWRDDACGPYLEKAGMRITIQATIDGVEEQAP